MKVFKILSLLGFVICLSACSEKDAAMMNFDEMELDIEIEDHGQFVYVSSSSGDDSNNGYQSTPVKTIKKAFELSDSIRLKAGDIFYPDEPLAINGQFIARYGKGPNPVISGFKRPKGHQWESIGGHVWKLNLAASNFSGVQIQGSNMINNIGCIYEFDKDLVHGHRVRYKSELKEDWDFWQTEQNDGTMPPSEFDNLFLYCKENPNSLNVEFSTAMAALQLENSQINGIDFLGFGFGLVPYSNSIIVNCKLDVIGGIQTVGNSQYACFGNGIEFYVWKDIENCLVENCIISRCYDSGVTIQAECCGSATPRNIIIRNCLLLNCCQGWEDFLRNNEDVKYENCVFEKNVVLNSGDTGWKYPSDRFKYCHVLGNNYTGDKGMIIRNNLFIGGNYYCSGSYNDYYRSNVWEDNICYLIRGNYLIGDYMGKKDVIRVPTDKGSFNSLEEATEKAIERYRDLSGDMTTKFVIVTEKEIRQLIRAEKNKFVLFN